MVRILKFDFDQTIPVIFKTEVSALPLPSNRPNECTLTMLFFKALWALVPLIQVSLAYYPSAPGLARDTAAAPQYAFDLNTGSELQVQTSEKPATELEFTTEGGTPYAMPYDYQRIGSDGRACHPLSIQAS